MDVSSEAIGNNISPDSLPMITDSTIYSAEMNVSLYDTSDIQLLEVKIGTTDGGSDLFNNNFAFDVSGSIGNGLTYTRNGYTIHLGLGSLQGLSHYYSEVRLKHQDGTYSPSISFNR